MTSVESIIGMLPWNWIEALDPSSHVLNGIPFSASPKGFSLTQFAEGFGRWLKVSDLSAQIHSGHVELLEEFPNWEKSSFISSYVVNGIEGGCFFIVPKADLSRLLISSLGGEKEEVPDSYLASFWPTFKQAVKSSFEGGFEPGYRPLSLDEYPVSTLRTKGMVTFSIELVVGEENFKAYLAFDQDFMRSWRQNESRGEGRGRLKKLLAKRIEVPVQLIVGETVIKKTEWDSLELGDFLTMDHLSYLPGADKGDGILFYGKTALSRIKIKEGAIKILELLTIKKELMPIQQPESHQNQIEGGDRELDDVFQEVSPLRDEEASTDELLQAIDLEESTLEESLQEDQPLSLTPMRDLEMNVQVGMGCFKISLEQLLLLQPGNVMKLDVDPSQGVDLLVEGKVIGRGELVQLGEILGVRITDLG